VKRLSLLAAILSGFLANAASAGNFTVGVEGQDYLPIASGVGGDYKGYSRELLDAFAAKAGHKFTYQPMPVARLWDEYLKQKSVDLKYPDNAYWNADNKKGLNITYSSGLINVVEGLMVPPANKGKGASSVTKIVTLRGFTPFPYLDMIAAKKVAVTEVNEAGQALDMAAAGRVDGVYMGKIAATYLLNDVMKKPGSLVFDDSLPNSKNDFSMSSMKHPDVIKQLNDFLASEKDLVAKLKAKYKIVE